LQEFYKRVSVKKFVLVFGKLYLRNNNNNNNNNNKGKTIPVTDREGP
jgi:hypothetical protein